MLAAVLKDYNQLALEDVPKPTPGPTQVIIKVMATGICATDHKAVRGKRRNGAGSLQPACAASRTTPSCGTSE